jgi:membrane glycosyltransferase
MHLFMGIMAYLGSPVWFLFLILGTWVAYDRFNSNLSTLPFESYVDRWFGINGTQQSILLTLGVFTLLFLPKCLALAGAVLNPRTRRSFGGAVPLVVGCWLEIVVSMLLAPCIMAAHTLMVLSIVVGKSVGWGNQNRETDGTSWGDAIRFHAFPTLLGVAWTALAIHISPNPTESAVFTAWMAPILLGLLLSAPVSVWTSRTRYGRALRRHHILATPEELITPDIISLADDSHSAVDAALDANAPSRTGVVAAVVDPYVNGVHVSLLENSDITEVGQALVERCLAQGPASLTKSEWAELLYMAPAILMMHRAVWLRSSEGIHPVWKQAVESYRRNLGHSILPHPN